MYSLPLLKSNFSGSIKHHDEKVPMILCRGRCPGSRWLLHPETLMWPTSPESTLLAASLAFKNGWNLFDFFLNLTAMFRNSERCWKSTIIGLVEKRSYRTPSCFMLKRHGNQHSFLVSCRFSWRKPCRRTGARDECEPPLPGATAKWGSGSIGGATRWESSGEPGEILALL